MSEPTVSIALRIPGKWAHPRELVEALPAGCRLSPESLLLPDGAQVDFGVMRADDQFAQIFRTSCRQPATADELETVDGYTVNVMLKGPGGSLPAARRMMRAGAAIVQAGGAGVFNDNSTLAHGGQNWIAMAEDGGSDALSFAFVAIVRGKEDVWTMGMHVLGLREVVMKRADVEAADEAEGMDIVEVIRYLARGDKPVANGHILADLGGPRFYAFTEPGRDDPPESPIYNPFGRLRLVSAKDVASTN